MSLVVFTIPGAEFAAISEIKEAFQTLLADSCDCVSAVPEQPGAIKVLFKSFPSLGQIRELRSADRVIVPIGELKDVSYRKEDLATFSDFIKACDLALPFNTWKALAGFPSRDPTFKCNIDRHAGIGDWKWNDRSPQTSMELVQSRGRFPDIVSHQYTSPEVAGEVGHGVLHQRPAWGVKMKGFDLEVFGRLYRASLLVGLTLWIGGTRARHGAPVTTLLAETSSVPAPARDGEL